MDIRNKLVFVPLKLSLMFVGKAGAYPRLEHLKGASLGKALALPANIRLGLPGTNTLAYNENS